MLPINNLEITTRSPSYHKLQLTEEYWGEMISQGTEDHFKNLRPKSKYCQFLAGHKEKAPAAETSQEVSMKPLPGWTRTRGSGFDLERGGQGLINQRCLRAEMYSTQ